MHVHFFIDSALGGIGCSGVLRAVLGCSGLLWGALFVVLEQIGHYRHFSWDKITILYQRKIKAIAVISEFQVVANFIFRKRSNWIPTKQTRPRNASRLERVVSCFTATATMTPGSHFEGGEATLLAQVTGWYEAA